MEQSNLRKNAELDFDFFRDLSSMGWKMRITAYTSPDS